MITEVFGVRGVFGNLLVHPKLLAEQFDEAGTASVSVTFAGKQFHVTYRNTDRKIMVLIISPLRTATKQQ